MSAPSSYHQRRDRAIAYGQWRPWADPGPARAHVRSMLHQGGTYASIGRAANLPAMTVYLVGGGEANIRPGTAAALLAVTIDDVTSARIPAGGTRLRLRSLMAMGHDCTRIARAAGASVSVIRKTVQGRAAEVTPQLHERVREVWEAWWDKTPPQRTPGSGKTPRRPAASPGGVTGVPPSAWTKNPSTASATSPSMAGCPPPAPAPHQILETPRPDLIRLAAKQKTSHTEEGSTMPFDPVPRQASEYQKGAAFGQATVMRQIDGGVPLDRIQETQAAAKAALTEAARTDGEREFLGGYATVVDERIATLRQAQRAEADPELQARGAEHEPELEAG